jgi:dTMP kinase
MFVTFEGLEGSGKSTQARLLADYVRAQWGEERVVLTREPGGTEIGEQIRQVIHSLRNHDMAPTTEFLLYNAARAQIVAQVIRPALAQGKIVLCDRYADSTIAYQGYGRQLDMEMVREVIRYATGGLVPDLTFYLDIPIEEGLARRNHGHTRGEELNRMDVQTRDFYERVRVGYETLGRENAGRWVVIDGARSIDQVQADLRKALAARLVVQAHRMEFDV